MKRTVFILGVILSFNANASLNGDCGAFDEKTQTYDDCHWSLDDVGNLKIWGTGNMADYTIYEDKNIWWRTNAPWADYFSTIKNVVVENGIKNIGEAAFYNSEILNIKLPYTVETIGNNAFQGSRLLKNIDIPESVTKIGDAAFNNSGLESIVIPNAVTLLGVHSLSENSNLHTIVMGDKVTEIDPKALADISPNSIIYCTGDINICKSNVGTVFADRVKQASKRQINGVTYVYDKNGKLVISSGHRREKRIYTIDEANAVAGEKNRVSITYR